MLGYGVAFGAYVGILLVLRRTPPPVWLAVALGLFLRLPWLVGPPTLSDDVWRYLHDGRAQVAGVNPYRYPPSAPEVDAFAGPERPLINHPELRTVYPPGAQLMFLVSAILGGSVLAWRAVLLICELALAAALVTVLRRRNLPPGRVAAYLLHPLPVIEFAGNGHVDGVALAALVVGLALLERKPLASGAAFACSIASKYLPVPVVPFAVRSLDGRGRWLFTTACLGALFAVYLPYLSVPPFGSLDTFATTFEFNGSFYRMFTLLLTPVAARGSLVLALLSVLAWLWWRRATADQAAFWWIGAVLLASPIVHPWYVTWLIPFFAWRAHAWAVAWTGTIILAYAVLPAWIGDGVWQLPAWVPWAEYLPVALVAGVAAAFPRIGTGAGRVRAPFDR